MVSVDLPSFNLIPLSLPDHPVDNSVYRVFSLQLLGFDGPLKGFQFNIVLDFLHRLFLRHLCMYLILHIDFKDFRLN